MERLHQTALLGLNFPRPVRLARRDQDVRSERLDVPIQLTVGVDGELRRILQSTVCAVLKAIRAVFLRVDFGKYVFGLLLVFVLRGGAAPQGENRPEHYCAM